MTPSDPMILLLGSAKSVLEFTRAGDESWPEWDRFLTLAGKRAFEIGNICNTCPFYFERLEGAPDAISPEDLVEALSAGPPPMDREWLESVGKVLPVGDYLPFYAEVPLRLVKPGEPGDYFADENAATWGIDPAVGRPYDPQTEYYRGRVHHLSPADSGNRAIFEFVIPMFPHERLDETQVLAYRAMAESRSPTALAVSVLDVKGPAVWEGELDVAEHWCLSHYLLDGHHKAYAAATAGVSLGVLSFLAVNQGVSTMDEVLVVVRHLASKVAKQQP